MKEYQQCCKQAWGGMSLDDVWFVGEIQEIQRKNAKWREVQRGEKRELSPPASPTSITSITSTSFSVAYCCGPCHFFDIVFNIIVIMRAFRSKRLFFVLSVATTIPASSFSLQHWLAVATTIAASSFSRQESGISYSRNSFFPTWNVRLPTSLRGWQKPIFRST